MFGNKITAGVFREVKMRSEEALVPPDLVLIKFGCREEEGESM